MHKPRDNCQQQFTVSIPKIKKISDEAQQQKLYTCNKHEVTCFKLAAAMARNLGSRDCIALYLIQVFCISFAA